jgi:outer membrane protein OmpU
VYILGSVQLDNGIKIKTRVELEGFTINDTTNDGANFVNGTSSQPDMVDEAYMDISGSFGSVRLGSADLAGKRMTTGHQATFFMNVGENTRFNITKVILKPSTVSNSVVSQLDLSSDGEGVSYVSPRWNGFVVGFGWAATSKEDTDADTLKSVNDHDIYDAAINWAGKFGDVGVSLAAGYTAAKSKTPGNSDPSQWSLGGRLTMGGLAIGLSTQHNESSTATGVSTDEDIIEAGVRYVMGPNAFSIVGAWSEMGGNVASSKNDETKAYSIAYRRTLGPGVTWHNTLHIADYNDGLAGAAASNSNDGYALTTGIKISF